MAPRMARNMREGHKVGWLIARRLKNKGMGIRLPCLPNDGDGLGMKGWREYANVSDKRAKGLSSKLHGDWRQQPKKQRVGRRARLARMMEPASEEGGGREGTTLTNDLRKSIDGTVLWPERNLKKERQEAHTR